MSHQAVKGLIRMTKAEWLAEGKGLFGDDMLRWRFVCPSCGHVQAPEDFRQYADQGATPDTARFNCIGRYDGHITVDAFQGPGTGPCNYTSGGLICIAPILVIDEDGCTYRSFDFDRSDQGDTA